METSESSENYLKSFNHLLTNYEKGPLQRIWGNMEYHQEVKE
jgi:hypothetical protein